MSELINLSTTDNIKELSVVLNEQTFADLILNFLGKKEKLTYILEETSFLIRQNDIEQFYYLLDAKIAKEQHVYIDHYLVTISYNDGTSREIAGIESLNKFLETRDVIPIDVTMTWNIIIKYPNAETIENQRIELTFAKDVEKKDGAIFLAIHHTNQVWGIEVLNLIKDKIGELIIKQSNAYKTVKFFSVIFNKQTSIVMMSLMISLMMISLSGQIINKHKDGEDYYKLISSYIKSQDATERDIALYSIANLKGNYLRISANKIIKNPELQAALLDIADSQESDHFEFSKKLALICLSIPLALLLIYFYLKKARSFYMSESFILISRRSESEYNQFINGKSKIEFYSITLILVSAFCGVIGNVMYQLIIDFF